ncbi:hypothetical protein [Streptomyces sp. NPDC058583]|uniref:hypothetical protein n=1 Tax=unclassified Streptomyces TaxID=2593676 RepID=UPI00364A69B5
MTDKTPPYMPPEGEAYDVMTLDDRWSALGVPLAWGRRVLVVLGDLGGPAFEDPGLRHVVWPLPPAAAADWPDLKEIGVVRYGAGDELLVPRARMTLSAGMCWLWLPEDGPAFIDPARLRSAIETLIGPLEEAAARGRVDVGHYCDAVVANSVLVAWRPQESGPGWSVYACQECARRHGLEEVRG